MEKLTKRAMAFGTGAAVIVPKEWMGSEVEISIKEKPWKQELFELISPHLEHIIGVYLTGSYAREEQRSCSDIDVLIVSKENPKLKSKRFHISILHPSILGKKTFLKIFLYAAILEAKPILNSSLLEDLKKKTRPSEKEIKEYLKTTKLSMDSLKTFIQMDKDTESEDFTAPSIIYSIILRLRGLYILKKSLKRKVTTLKEFKSELKKEGINASLYKKFHRIYSKEKQDMKLGKEKILLTDVEKFADVLEKWYDQRSKELKLWKKG